LLGESIPRYLYLCYISRWSKPSMSKKIAKGKSCYARQKGQVRAEGLTLTSAEMNAALRDRVSNILFDDEGRGKIQEALSGAATTEFAAEQLQEILAQPPTLNDWQVGEAIADAWLTDHCSCRFPWPSSRDLRNRNASPAGADLVGFHLQKLTYRFAFGEVKTSFEAKYPPQVVTSRHGVTKQLETLRDDQVTKHQLFIYLAHRAPQTDWYVPFQQAATRYLQSNTDVSLFGVLVRDVAPNVKDVEGRIAQLAKECPNETSIELLAFYLPLGTIRTLAQNVNQLRKVPK
jgi:hypothetical protein